MFSISKIFDEDGFLQKHFPENERHGLRALADAADKHTTSESLPVTRLDG